MTQVAANQTVGGVKKIVFAVIGLGLLAIVGFLGYHVVKGFLGARQVPADLATRPWVEHKLIPDTLVIDVPSPLKSKESPTDKGSTESNIFTCNGNGLRVECGAKQVGVSTSEKLDFVVDGVVTYSRKHTVEVSAVTKTPTSVMGVRAIELQMEVKEKWKPSSQMRAVYFIYNGYFCQIHCNSGLNQPVASAAWDRIKKSIRPPQGVAAQPKTGITRGELPLPPGIKRRTH